MLPGGGALGAYQVGILKALTEAGVAPDQLIGVSAGAVNASLFAWNQGIDGVAHLEQIWSSMRRKDLMKINPARIAMAFVGLRPSFFDNRPGIAFLRRHLGYRELQYAPIPLSIVTTDVSNGRAVVLDEGDAVTAVIASCSFPGVFPPMRHADQLLMDGGVVADIPLDVAEVKGAASVLICSVPALEAGPPPEAAIELLFRASTFGVEAHGRTMLARPPAGLIVVEVDAPPSTITTFAIGDAAQIIEDGYAATVTWLNS